MNALTAISEGLRRVAAAPRLLLGLWLLSVLAALPAALVMQGLLAESIGPSLFHEGLEQGFDSDWYAEFQAESPGGLADTFSPSLLGIGAVYDNLEAWWSGRIFSSFPVGLLALGVAYALVWTLLLGGVFDVLARRATPGAGMSGFMAAGGRTFGRFLQLAVVAGAVYSLIYGLSGWLFGRLQRSMRDVTTESALFARVVLVAALVVLLLHLARLVFDYAKIAVYADDVSATAALQRAVFFIAGRPFAVLGVWAGLGVVTVLVIGAYALVAPGAGQSSVLTVILAFLVSQLYLASRIATRLALYGAEIELYRRPPVV